MKRDFSMLLGCWLVLAAILFGMGRQHVTAPGLFYDEAVFGGLSKDFLTGKAGPHMPGVRTIEFSGRPFPVFVQPYLGALKCWLLIPAFKLYGSTIAVLRGTNFCLAAAVLLVCMLWMWRLLGLAEALLAGALLASDPAFFFCGWLDWGSLISGLVCRLMGFYLALLAWRGQRKSPAFWAGIAFGLSFFNKIDSGIVLAGAALASVYAGGRSIGPAWRTRPGIFLAMFLGFLIAAGTSLALIGKVMQTVYLQNNLFNTREYTEKFNALGAMYDGSYFYRLMSAGGKFDRMYDTPAPVWTPFGLMVVIAAVVLLIDIVKSPVENPSRAPKMFLLLTTFFVSLGILILPGAVRLHHTGLVYPFPHLLIAVAIAAVWRRRPKFSWQRPAGIAAVLLAALLLGCNFLAVQRTSQIIRETGGRGWWSDALEAFAVQVGSRSDVTVASLDWGFNEQLEFLTRGPKLDEPFWLAAFGLKPDLPRDPRYIYLAHPPEFSLSPVGGQFMESVARENTNAVVRPWCDGQGRVAFYSISFTGK